MPPDSSTTSPYLQNYQQPQYVSRINNKLIMSPESTTTSSALQNHQQPHHVSRINNLILCLQNQNQQPHQN